MRSKTFCKIMNEAGQVVFTGDFNKYYTRVNNWLFTWYKNGVVDAHPIDAFGYAHVYKPNDLRRMVKRALNTEGI